MEVKRRCVFALIVFPVWFIAWLMLGQGKFARATAPDHAVLAGAPYKRIISLYGAHTVNLVALDAVDRIIGVDRQSVYLSGVTGKPVFSYHDDPERFLAARPDLVLVRPMIERGYPRLVHRLRQSGIQVVSCQPTEVSQLTPYWNLLGTLVGNEPEARAVATRFASAVDEFKRLSGRVENPERVYFEAIHSKMKTFSPTAMAIFVLETAGGMNVASDAPVREKNNIAVYGKERLLSHAGQIDVFLSQQGPMNRISVAAIMDEPGFGAIKAVKEGRVYQIEETIVSRPTMELLVGIYRIGCLLYPDLYCSEGRRILEMAGMNTDH